MLAGQDFEQLHAALLDAFPTPALLERLVRFGLNESLAEIALGESLADLVLKLITWANAQNQVNELVQAALTRAPRNTHLLAYAAAHSISLPTPSVRPGPLDSAPTCPYPGLKPFQTQDAALFFGRDAEIESMLWRLRQQVFLVVLGPSGSGKSSLVMAGLLPSLVRQQPGVRYVVKMRPGAHPLMTLTALLGGDPGQPEAVVAALLAAHPPAKRLLLVVDQLEEIFSQGEHAEEGVFIAALKGLWALPTCQAVLTLRADFYPDLMQSDLWPIGEGERQEVGPLRDDALRAAIEHPAAALGVAVEPRLLDRLLHDTANEPGSQPLLQETLRLLWEEMVINGERTLTLAAYEALGRAYATPQRSPTAPLNGLAVALALHADVVMQQLTRAQQAIARRIFVRLIQFCEGRPDTRQQQSRSRLETAQEDQALFSATLAALTDTRLLTVSGLKDDPEQKVDIAHEALITGWPTLYTWVAERRKAEQTRRWLEAQATVWVRAGRGQTHLLDEGELADAEAWLRGPDVADLGYSDDLLQLVTHSRMVIDATRNRALHLERRARRATQAFALAMALLALIASTLLVILVLAPQLRRARAAGPLLTIPPGRVAIGLAAPVGSAECERCDNEMPRWTAIFTSPFSIEQYEVANWRYRICVEDSACTEPQDPMALQHLWDAAFADHPVAGVDARQAFAYCHWLGRRLPTEVEWERAARGPEGWDWPWGNEPSPDARHANLAYDSNPQIATQPVMSYTLGVSKEGVYNLVGNVAEWTASFSSPCYQPTECDYSTAKWWRDGRLISLPPDGEGYLIERGGGWQTELPRLSQRIASEWRDATPYLGFRCATGDTTPAWAP